MSCCIAGASPEGASFSPPQKHLFAQPALSHRAGLLCTSVGGDVHQRVAFVSGLSVQHPTRVPASPAIFTIWDSNQKKFPPRLHLEL